MNVSQTLMYRLKDTDKPAASPKAKYLPHAVACMFFDHNPEVPYHFMQIDIDHKNNFVQQVTVRLEPLLSTSDPRVDKLKRLKGLGHNAVLNRTKESVTLGYLMEEKAFLRKDYDCLLENIQMMITQEYGLR